MLVKLRVIADPLGIQNELPNKPVVVCKVKSAVGFVCTSKLLGSVSVAMQPALSVMVRVGLKTPGAVKVIVAKELLELVL